MGNVVWKQLVCSICGKGIEPETYYGRVVWSQGNNAEPVTDGRCCNSCNASVVIPARLRQLIHNEKGSKGGKENG
jgi:hypothetical protein